MESTATGWPAASSCARLTAARLKGEPDEASSTAAGDVGCGSKRRRPNSIPQNPPGYRVAGGSPGDASEPPTGPATLPPSADSPAAPCPSVVGAPPPSPAPAAAGTASGSPPLA